MLLQFKAFNPSYMISFFLMLVGLPARTYDLEGFRGAKPCEISEKYPAAAAIG